MYVCATVVPDLQSEHVLKDRIVKPDLTKRGLQIRFDDG